MATTQGPTPQFPPVETEAMTPAGFGLDPTLSMRNPLTRRLSRLFIDKRGNVSRPKLVFLVMALDMAIVLAASMVAASLADGGALTGTASWLRAVVIAFAVAAAMHANWGYTISAIRRAAGQAEKIVKSVASVFCLFAGTAYLAGIHLFTPAFAIAWLVVVMIAMIASRLPLAALIDRLTRAGRLVRRTVIVGGGGEAEALIATLKREQVHRIEILGVFDDRQDARSADTFLGYPKLGTFDQLSTFCRNAGVDLLVVTVPVKAEERLMQILARLMTIPVDIRISAQSSRLRLSSRAYSYIGSVPMLAVMERPLSDWSRAVKNIEDRVLGLLLLLLAAPVLAVCALAIRLDSKGPIFFKQRRYGFNNELIEVYKLRSMYTDMADATASKLATRDDPRITPVGRFLRRSSLDELPQLFNVVKGEMSIVGPRPHATGAKAATDLYQSVVDGYFARHRVKPGVTGWAQVNGWRGETDTHEKIQKRVEHDLYYIDNWSVLFDLYIVALTPIALLTGKNAY